MRAAAPFFAELRAAIRKARPPADMLGTATCPPQRAPGAGLWSDGLPASLQDGAGDHRVGPRDYCVGGVSRCRMEPLWRVQGDRADRGGTTGARSVRSWRFLALRSPGSQSGAQFL